MDDAKSQNRIIFITGHCFGKMALEGLIESGLMINKIYCLHPRNAQGIAGYDNLAFFSEKHHIEYEYFNHVKEIELSVIKDKANFIFVVGLSQLVSQTILDSPMKSANHQHPFSDRHGCIGMHPTLLPMGRGRAPIPWTVQKQLKSTGLSCFFLTDKADQGPILGQVQEKLPEKPTSTDVFDIQKTLHKTLGLEIGSQMINGDISYFTQDEDKATYWGKRTPKDSWIDLSLPYHDIELLVAVAQAPYPEAFIVGDTEMYLVQEIEFSDALPKNTNKLKFFKCRDGYVLLRKYKSRPLGYLS